VLESNHGPAPPSAAQAPRRLGLALVVIATAQLMVVLDLTIVTVALPHMQTSLGFSGSNLEWVVNAYAVSFGGLLLLGGRSGDLLERRRVFIAGLLVFSLASLVASLAAAVVLLAAFAVIETRSTAGLRRVFRYHREVSGVAAGHSHALRHTFGTAFAGPASADAVLLQPSQVCGWNRCRISPMPSTQLRSSSPGCRKRCGVRATPTPDGVPVKIRSPGYRVTIEDR
jgi:Major Facilitator Superfamily